MRAKVKVGRMFKSRNRYRAKTPVLVRAVLTPVKRNRKRMLTPAKYTQPASKSRKCLLLSPVQVIRKGVRSDVHELAWALPVSSDSDGEKQDTDGSCISLDACDNQLDGMIGDTSYECHQFNEPYTKYTDQPNYDPMIHHSYCKDADTRLLIEKINSLLPSVVPKLKEHDLLSEFVSFLSLVSADQIPLDNIALRLAFDVVNWYNTPNTVAMRYSPQSMRFWNAVRLLGHGSVIRLFSGTKNLGNVVSGDELRGNFDPAKSDINFAIPSDVIRKVNTTFGNDSKLLQPGIINQCMEVLNKQDCYVASVDLKKITTGLTKEAGEADLFGFEVGESKLSKDKRLSIELAHLESIEDFYNKSVHVSDINDLPDKEKTIIRTHLKDMLSIVSVRIKDIRMKVVRMKITLDTLKKKAGDNWRQSKFVMVISKIQAILYQINDFVKSALQINGDICRLLSFVNGSNHNFSLNETIDICRQGNMMRLGNQQTIGTEYQGIPELTKQGSEEWLLLRQLAPLQASVLHTAIGQRTLKEQCIHYDHVFLGKPKPPFSDQIKRNFAYGHDNEPNAIITLVSVLLPALYPSTYFAECGAYFINNDDMKLIEVSPDGVVLENGGQSLSLDANGRPIGVPKFAVEVKCPVPAPYKTSVFYSLPVYYICQCLSQMAALHTTELLFVSYCQESVSLLVVEWDGALWDMIMKEASRVYMDGHQRPKHVSEQAKIIKIKLTQFNETNVKFIAEVPASRAYDAGLTYVPFYGAPYQFLPANLEKSSDPSCDISLEDILSIMHKCDQLLRDGHELCREPAQELVVWLLSSTDRQSDPQHPLSFPICYGLRGQRLPVECMRAMTEYVYQVCYKNDINISLLAFDGQFHQMAVTDGNGKVNTLYQLQRSVWQETAKLQKSAIIKQLKALVPFCLASSGDISVDKPQEGSIVLATHGNVISKIVNMLSKPYVWLKPIQVRKPRNKDVTLELQDDMISTNPEDTVQPVGENEGIPLFPAEVQALLSDYPEDELTEIVDSVKKQLLVNIEPLYDDRSTSNSRSTSAIFEELSSTFLFTDIVQFDESLGSSYDREDANCNQGLSTHDEIYIGCQEEVVTQECAGSILEYSDSSVDILGLTSCLTDSNISSALESLRLDKNANKKDKWGKRDCSILAHLLSSSIYMSGLTHDDLNVLIPYFFAITKNDQTFKKSKHSKEKKIEILSDLIAGLTPVLACEYEPKKLIKLEPLHVLALRAACIKWQKVPKKALNALYATVIYPERLKAWQEASPVKTKQVFSEHGECLNVGQWFYVPEYNKLRGRLEPKVVDATHILTNLRRLVSTKGMHGISVQAWLTVARKNETRLTLAMVEDLVDRQSAANARTTFSHEVEQEMISEGFLEEAKFVHLVRSWYEAEDEPGLTAFDRMVRRIHLRDYLLEGVDFGCFPPNLQYIKGIPVVTFESLLSSIDCHIQLYALCAKGTYNQRAASSLASETFFSFMLDMDPAKSGCLKASDVSRCIATTCEFMKLRLNPARGFCMSTTKNQTVYPQHDPDMAESAVKEQSALEFDLIDEVAGRDTHPEYPIHDPFEDEILVANNVQIGATPISPVMEETQSIEEITVRDHFFDSKERMRTKGRRKTGYISKPHEPARGSKPVGQYFRKDESKILPTKRLGIDMVDLSEML